MKLNRAALIVTLGIVLAPLGANAQQAVKVYRIGLFHVGLDHVPPSLDTLRHGWATRRARTCAWTGGTCLTKTRPIPRRASSSATVST